MASQTKKQKKLAAEINTDKTYLLEEALNILTKNTSAKFTETVDVSLNLGVDPRHADQVVRGVCQLPHGTGKTVRVAVFARGAKAEEARAAGADVVGAEDLADKVQAGQIDFDRCIATPDMMMIIGKLGKILGPRGLMPNPKIGTVTNDINQAVQDVKAGSVEFRCEKAGIVHAGVGKVNFNQNQLIDNIVHFVSTVAKSRPSGAKGTFLKKVTISTTQGVGLKIDLSELASRFAA